MKPFQLLRRAAIAFAIVPALAACTAGGGIEDGFHTETPQRLEAGHSKPNDETLALLGQGKKLLAQGAPSEANLIFKRAVRYSAGHPEAVGALARSYLILRRADDALGEYELALAQDAGNPRWLSGRGVALDQLGRHDEAQQSYKAARATAPEGTDAFANATINLALSLAVAGDRSTATEFLKRLALDGRYAVRARHNLAVIEALGGDTQASAALLRGELDQAMAAKAARGYAHLRTSKNPASGLPIR